MRRRPILNGCLSAALLAIPALAQSQMRNAAVSQGLPLLRAEPEKFVAKAAAQIDALMLQDWQRQQMKPVAPADDATWVRRTYLGIIGRIPTFKEFKVFMEDKSPDKKAKLIDQLLASDGYNSHMFNFWANLLRATHDFGEGRSGLPYLKWIREAVAKNKPYNQMVTELLTSKGGMWEEGNGAVGYFVRDLGMPLDNMANTTRVFMGAQIACAQCHDHPYDDWKRKDFLEMAAFTHGLKTLKDDAFLKKVGEQEEERTKGNKALDDIERTVRYAFVESYVRDETDGLIQVPKDYQYRDAKPGEMIGARTMMGKSVRNLGTKPMKDARGRFAEWLTSPENPTFTKVIANRMWKEVFAVGLVEPLDDFKKNTTASNPQLMDFLANLMVEVKYDLKAFQRVLYNTKTYGLSTATVEVPEGSRWHFNGRPLRRMTAEQVWDSMLTLMVDDVDSRKSPAYDQEPTMGGKPMSQIQAEVAGVSAEKYWDYLEDLLSKGGRSEYMMMSGGRGEDSQLLRASELRQPAPAEHFLRKFGQSDRVTIDGATAESDVTQALSLLNGVAERAVVNNSGALIRTFLRKCGTPEQKVNMIYYSILNRVPSPEEKAPLLAEIERDPGAGELTLLSAALNSVEFIFIQ